MLQPHFNTNTNNSNTHSKPTTKRREKTGGGHHHEKHSSIGNMSHIHDGLKQNNSNYMGHSRGFSSSGKENNLNIIHGPRQVISEKDDKLLLKEKEILKRINKIESFLKRP